MKNRHHLFSFLVSLTLFASLAAQEKNIAPSIENDNLSIKESINLSDATVSVLHQIGGMPLSIQMIDGVKSPFLRAILMEIKNNPTVKNMNLYANDNNLILEALQEGENGLWIVGYLIKHNCYNKNKPLTTGESLVYAILKQGYRQYAQILIREDFFYEVRKLILYSIEQQDNELLASLLEKRNFSKYEMEPRLANPAIGQLQVAKIIFTVFLLAFLAFLYFAKDEFFSSSH